MRQSRLVFAEAVVMKNAERDVRLGQVGRERERVLRQLPNL